MIMHKSNPISFLTHLSDFKNFLLRNFTLKIASCLGFLAVVFGAFGAHILKAKISESSLEAFKTGVLYQLTHALLLLILGYLAPNSFWIKTASKFFIIGILLFSGSLYLLATQSYFNHSMKFVGPITPLGGLCLMIGWLFLIIHAFKAQNAH